MNIKFDMTKTLGVILFSLFLQPIWAFAQDAPFELPCDQIVDVKVNGLVCDFCARAIEKVFTKREEVTDTKVDLSEGQILIGLKPGQSLDNGTIEQYVNDAGYDMVSVGGQCEQG